MRRKLSPTEIFRYFALSGNTASVPRSVIGPVVSDDSEKLAFKLHFRRHSDNPQPAMVLQRTTSVPGPQPLIEGPLTELLERISLPTSARDIPRLSLV